MRACVALATLCLVTTQAVAVDDRVEAACSADYSTYCSQHDPDGPGVRRCMRDNGSRLSDPCVQALILAGELTSDELARYKEARRQRR